MIIETVLVGVFVFVASQLLKVIFLDPLLNFRKVIAKIDNRLKYYSNTITSPSVESEHAQEATVVLRELSSELEQSYKVLPFTKTVPTFYGFFFSVPAKAEVAMAATDLIYLHNSRGQHADSFNNDDAMMHIRELLNIPQFGTASHSHKKEED